MPRETREDLQERLDSLARCEQLAQFLGIEFDDSDRVLCGALETIDRRRGRKAPLASADPNVNDQPVSMSEIGPSTRAAMAAIALGGLGTKVSAAATKPAEDPYADVHAVVLDRMRARRGLPPIRR